MRARIFSRLLASTAACALLVSAGTGAAQSPQAPSVAAGSITVSRQGATTVVSQATDKGVIDWRSFSIGPQETVRFDQPGRSSVTLNRVTGAEQSRIDGNLSATGQVWLANPNGVMIGPGGQVNVGGLLATTGRVDATAFLNNGQARIDQVGKDAAIVNQGTINIQAGGYAALAAASIRNEGVVAARTGSVAMGAGKAMTLDFAGDKLITFQVTQPLDQAPAGAEAAIVNDGVIAAQGGTVLMTARAAKGAMDNVINLRGHVVANSVRVDGGTVTFGDGGVVQVSGKVDASNASGVGGSVAILGEKVGVMDGATIDASGSAGGGTVLVGGDWQGKGAVQNASVAYVAPTASINVDATQNGNGGKAVVWADDATRFNGTISARGGAASGDGGQVETSGKKLLAVGPSAGVAASTRSANGRAGAWLLDPNNITITNTTDSNVTGTPNFVGGGGTNATLTVATINSVLAGGTSVSVQTTTGGSGGNGDISFTNGTITTSFSGGALSLKLLADRNIMMSSGTKIDLTGNAHNIVLAARANSGTDGGVVVAGTVQTAGGSITIGGGPVGTLSAIGNATSSNIGVWVQTAGLVSSNGGAISLIGDGANLAGGSFGLYLQGTIQSAAGSINITGTGVGQTGPSNVHGVLVSGATIAATGSGAITITGTRGLGNFSANIQINGGSSISTVNGALTLNGTSSVNGGSTSNFGVMVDNSTVETTGSGSITMNGVGSTAGVASDYGVAIGLGNPTIVRISGTGSGAIAINGLGRNTDAGLAMNQGTISTSNGSAIFNVNALNLTSQVISIGGASTTFKTYQPASSIGVNGASGTLSLSNSFLNSIGPASLIIGDAAMTGAINVATGYVINRAVAFKGGANSINFAGTTNADVGATRSLQIDNTGTVSFGGAVGGLTPLASLVVNSGTTFLNGGVTTNFATNGSIFFSGRMILSANATLTTANSRIVVQQTDAASSGTQSLTLNAGTGSISLSGAMGGSTKLNTLTTTGTTYLGGAVKTTGTQSYGGPMVLNASAQLSTTSSAIFFGSVDAATSVTASLSLDTGTAGLVSFSGAVGGGSPLSSLTYSSASTGIAYLGGNVTTTGLQSYNNVVLNASSVLTTNGANVSTGLNVNAATGAESLTLALGTGAFQPGASIGNATPLASITQSSGTFKPGPVVRTSGTQSFAAVVLTTNALLSTTNNGNITLGSLNATSGETATFTTGTGVLTLTTGAGGSTQLGSLLANSSSGAVVLGGTVSTSGAQSYAGDVTLASATSITAGSLIFAKKIDSASGLNVLSATVTVSGAAPTFTGAIGSSTPISNFTVSTTDAAIALPATTAQSLTLSSGSGPVTQGGAWSISNQTTINTTSGAITLTNGANDFNKLGLTIGAIASASVRDGVGSLEITGANVGTGVLTIAGANAVTQSGAISAPTLSLTNGSSVILNNASNTIGTLTGSVGGGTALVSLTNNGSSTPMKIASLTAANITLSQTGGNALTLLTLLSATNAASLTSGGNLSFAGGAAFRAGTASLTGQAFSSAATLSVANAPLTLTGSSGTLSNVQVGATTGTAVATPANVALTTPGAVITVNTIVMNGPAQGGGGGQTTATVASTISTLATVSVASVASVATVATVATVASIPTVASSASIPSFVIGGPIPIQAIAILSTPLPVDPTPLLKQILPEIPAPNFLLSLPPPEPTPGSKPAALNAAEAYLIVTNTPPGALVPPGPGVVFATGAPLAATPTIKVDPADAGGANGQVIAFGAEAGSNGGSTTVMPGLLSETKSTQQKGAAGEPPLAQLPSTLNEESMLD